MSDIINLEIKVSELEQIVADLNDVVTTQWASIDRQKLENQQLKQRLNILEEALKSLNSTPPPHY